MYREIRVVRGVQRLSERVIGSEGGKSNKAGTIGIERQGREKGVDAVGDEGVCRRLLCSWSGGRPHAV